MVFASLGLAILVLLYLFSVFTMVSMMGVVLGVAALTIALAMTSGFQHQFKEKVLGVNAHVFIRQNGGLMKDYRKVMDQASKHPDVLAVHPFHFVQMQVTNGKGVSAGVAIKGIVPETVGGVLDIHKNMEKGKVETLIGASSPKMKRYLEDFTNGERKTDKTKKSDKTFDDSQKEDSNKIIPDSEASKASKDAPIVLKGKKPKVDLIRLPSIILGSVLAKKLKVDLGDEVTVVAPFSNLDFSNWTQKKGQKPVQQKFTVTGTFYSGFDEYDRKLMYINLLDSQDLSGKGDQVLGVELKIKNIYEAKEVAMSLGETLGKEFIVEDWHKLNEPLFRALSMQKILIAIILTIIIMVASFNMVSALTMLVVDKTREIAILRSMGATENGMSRVFLLVGLAIGFVGTVLGLILGIVFCGVFDRYDYDLDPKVYFIDKLPFIINWQEVLLIVGITLVISALSTIVPSRKAAAMLPLEGLRHD